MRPHVRLEEGVTRKIDWPETVFYRASVPGADRDAVILLGVEPNTRWRTFSQEITGLAVDLGVELFVTLGALLADVPHTRPAPVTGSASDPALVEELGLASSRYEGRRESSASSTTPAAPRVSPRPACGRPCRTTSRREPEGGARALAAARALLDVSLDLTDLERAAEAYELQVSAAVAQDEETEAYVRELETRRDALGEELDVPSGGHAGRRAHRFLKEHEERARATTTRADLAEREGVGLRARREGEVEHVGALARDARQGVDVVLGHRHRADRSPSSAPSVSRRRRSSRGRGRRCSP